MNHSFCESLKNIDSFRNEASDRIWVNDYVYMRTNNAIISDNQSKELIALWCLHVKSKALHSRLHAISIILIR